MNHDGVITPETQAEFLKKYGHLEEESTNYVTVSKYYTLGENGYRVLFYDKKPIQVTKMKAKEAKVMAESALLKFGGF